MSWRSFFIESQVCVQTAESQYPGPSRLTVLTSLTLVLVGCGGQPQGDADAGSSGAKKRIGPSGGTVAVGAATLTVPAGALDQEVEIEVTTGEVGAANVHALSRSYVFSPNGLVFNAGKGATLTIALAKTNESAQLFRGEAGSDAFSPVPDTRVEGLAVSATIPGFSYYFLGYQPSTANTFMVDGVLYGFDAVARGAVDGFAYSYPDALGRLDGYGGSGRVWYGPDGCMTVRTDGTGFFDEMGGTRDSLYGFDWRPLDLLPGTWATVAVISPLELGPGREVLPPDYRRDAYLHPFRWGVRLNDDGSVYQSLSGNIEFYFKYDTAPPGSLFRAEWKRGQGPVGTLDPWSSNPANTPVLCRFRESRSADPTGGKLCRDEPVTYLGKSAIRHSCYVAGERSGEYSVTSSSGAPIYESGQFASNHPVGGWRFNSVDGGPSREGSFDEQGFVTGLWTHWGVANSRIEATFRTGNAMPWGRRYLTALEGPYQAFDSTDGGVYLKDKGSLLAGHQAGQWLSYNSAGCVVQSQEFDANIQVPLNTSTCLTVDGGRQCISHTRSFLQRLTHFSRGTCVPGLNFIRETTYRTDGGVAAETCFNLVGCEQPVRGATTPCPTVCRQ